MLVKMVLEPIWESDFLNCSNGFRPGRRTMDCIALLDSYINNRNKYYWVIEGDIQGAFDNIRHDVLLDLMAKRVADRRMLALIARFLKAGVIEGGGFSEPNWAPAKARSARPSWRTFISINWTSTGGTSMEACTARSRNADRQEHAGNCALIRYADDWLLFTNGGKAEAYRLRDEFQTFLARN